MWYLIFFYVFGNLPTSITFLSYNSCEEARTKISQLYDEKSLAGMLDYQYKVFKPELVCVKK